MRESVVERFAKWFYSAEHGVARWVAVAIAGAALIVQYFLARSFAQYLAASVVVCVVAGGGWALQRIEERRIDRSECPVGTPR